MQYHWLRDHQTQCQFNIYWDKGSNNHADYFTKHHLAKYYQEIWRTRQYIQDRPEGEVNHNV